MKLVVFRNQINMTPEQFLRRAGYGYIRDRHTGQDSFVRRLGSFHYPRLHMYVEEQDNKIIFNLHLDQKQASYTGAHMHNAEYEGPVVEAEIERLKGLIRERQNTEQAIDSEADDLLNKISRGEYSKDVKKPKRSWWKKILNRI